jgi:hypothetical protein
MTSTEPLPTPKQLHYLRTLAGRTGQTFVTPRTRREASVQISSLRAVRSRGYTFAELPWELATREADGNVAIIESWEIAGYGSTATWSQRS